MLAYSGKHKYGEGYLLEVRDEKTRDQWFDYGDEVDTSRGNSGSPVWVRSTIDRTAHFRLVGVHVRRSPHIPNIYNIGIRLISEDRDLIETWMQGKPLRPLESVVLSADSPSPTVSGQQITFTAEAEAGINPEFRFYYRPRGGSWKPFGSFSPDNTFTTSPRTTGDFEVGVLARSSGSTETVKDITSHNIPLYYLGSNT